MSKFYFIVMGQQAAALPSRAAWNLASASCSKAQDEVVREITNPESKAIRSNVLLCSEEETEQRVKASLQTDDKIRPNAVASLAQWHDN